MTAWVWVDRTALELLHGESLAEHGGVLGRRGEGLLASALARPRQLVAYGDPPPDLAALAVAYGIGLARNHPFVDGNKRAAFLAVGFCLLLNSHRLVATQAEATAAMVALAAGELEEEAFSAWLRRRMRPRA